MKHSFYIANLTIQSNAYQAQENPSCRLIHFPSSLCHPFYLFLPTSSMSLGHLHIVAIKTHYIPFFSMLNFKTSSSGSTSIKVFPVVKNGCPRINDLLESPFMSIIIKSVGKTKPATCTNTSYKIPSGWVTDESIKVRVTSLGMISPDFNSLTLFSGITLILDHKSHKVYETFTPPMVREIVNLPRTFNFGGSVWGNISLNMANSLASSSYNGFFLIIGYCGFI